MNKLWWLGGGAAVVVALGVGVATGVIRKPGGDDPARVAKAGEGQAGQNGKDGKKADVPLEFVPREVVQPVVAHLPGLVEFSGPLVAPQTALVRAKAGGTLLSLDVICQVEYAALGNAERTHASNERLVAQQFISQIALENSRAALDTARANLAAAQASLETTKVALRDGTLLAPISGIVAKRHALAGEKVAPEQQVLSIVDLSRLELAGTIGTHEVARLSAGLPVQVEVEGVAQPVQGRIARIAPAAEPGTRSIGVTIELDNPKEVLRAGQYALAHATLADDADRLTLPVAAVGNTSGQDHVWVIENGVLARRAVTLGRRDTRAGRVELLAGVSPQSQVLAARFDNLREGAKALIVAAKAQPGDKPQPVDKAAAVASAAASTPLVK